MVGVSNLSNALTGSFWEELKSVLLWESQRYFETIHS